MHFILSKTFWRIHAAHTHTQTYIRIKPSLSFVVRIDTHILLCVTYMKLPGKFLYFKNRLRVYSRCLSIRIIASAPPSSTFVFWKLYRTNSTSAGLFLHSADDRDWSGRIFFLGSEKSQKLFIAHTFNKSYIFVYIYWWTRYVVYSYVYTRVYFFVKKKCK